MSGLSYFAIQIQSWFLKTQSTSNHSPRYFSNVESKSKWSPKYLQKAAFSQQKFLISFPLTQSKSGPHSKFWNDLQSGSNQNSTQFAIVRIQSNTSPVQCSSLIRTANQTSQWDRKIQCENSCRRMLTLFQLFGAVFLFIGGRKASPPLFLALHPWASSNYRCIV